VAFRCAKRGLRRFLQRQQWQSRSEPLLPCATALNGPQTAPQDKLEELIDGHVGQGSPDLSPGVHRREGAQESGEAPWVVVNSDSNYPDGTQPACSVNANGVLAPCRMWSIGASRVRVQAW